MLQGAAEATMAMTALVDRLNGMCDAVPSHVGWYLEDLRTGERADRPTPIGCRPSCPTARPGSRPRPA
jgi:hypothetical protein